MNGTNPQSAGPVAFQAGNSTTQSVEPERFAFGRNWQRFLSTLDEDRIRIAEESLTSMLQISSLEGKTFLDIGSGKLKTPLQSKGNNEYLFVRIASR